MNILVIGGTGTVGSCVVSELVNRGATVRVLTRDPGKARLPAGVAAIQGNLLDPQTVRSVFRGMDGVFMLNALGTSETHEGLMGVMGAQQAGVRRFAYMTVHHLDRAPHFPHFGSKRPVESALQASDVEYTIVRPNNFFQNDHWFKDAILQGVYPQPIGSAGLSRVDVRDIAEVAAKALTESGHERKIYELTGPEVLTGEKCAEIWTRALGRKVVYGGDDLDAWETGARAWLPDWLAYDLRMMYGWFQTHGLVADTGEVEKLTKLLGHAPRRLEHFAREIAPVWLSKAA
ncbi:MAG: NmrA family NAD(P)-binding protein [Nibricoccus sp.]